MIAEGGTSQKPLVVTYIGNTGYVIQCQGSKVAIDALFGGWTSDTYDIPPDSIAALMKSAQPPFDNINIIAVTHYHKDHFDPRIMVQHLKSNTRGIVLCPPQVADSLAAQPGFDEIQRRIYVIKAPIDSVRRYDQDGISALVLSSKHGSYYGTDETGKTVDFHRNTQHLEYLFTIDGRSFFHSGDVMFEDKYKYGSGSV